MPRMVNCIKLGREAEGLDFPRCRENSAAHFLKTSPRSLAAVGQAADDADQRESPEPG